MEILNVFLLDKLAGFLEYKKGFRISGTGAK